MRKGGNVSNMGSQEVVGLIPAGGTGSRIAPLPMSKELFPIGFQTRKGQNSPRPKVVSQYLLEKFAKAGIRKAFIIIRQGKWDIPAYFGHGELVNMHLGYLIMGESYGPPFTLDQGYPFVRDKLVAFGFPDIMFTPEDVFKQLLEYREADQSDVVLGLFPAYDFRITDMVDVDENGKIHNILVNPANTELHFTWLCGLWTPVFTQFMHEYLQDYQRENNPQMSNVGQSKGEDLTVGTVLQAAIKKGLNVDGVAFPDGRYIDIGTPDNLVKSIEMYGCQFS
jgi:dTDP-glucose pyrophosphorylase